MGLVDAAVGTTVSAYLGFKLMNRALERVFFQASRTRKLDLAKELVVVSNGERLCLQVVYDASTGKFFSPIIHQDADSNILENSFLLRSMVFPERILTILCSHARYEPFSQHKTHLTI